MAKAGPIKSAAEIGKALNKYFKKVNKALKFLCQVRSTACRQLTLGALDPASRYVVKHKRGR